MNGIALKVENVSKQYRLGTVGTGTLSQDLNRWYARMRGKEDPFLKIGESNDRTTSGNSDFVWALKDLNFEIKKGDVVGIIGRNGAGKSTLLKLLSKTTLPTTGKIKINGRIASLLEVGTGFHPELTGRDNIFLNGAILGMTKKEIQSKFDEIVEFAGVARYVDTPVKRYSSGMYVRLAFAVAAHLDPDILIVDEVLAVGDIEFQKKAVGKMKSVSEEGGRTVLFVSHNMGTMSALCNTSIVMDRGRIVYQGTINNGIDYYLNNNKDVLTSHYKNIDDTQRGISDIWVQNIGEQTIDNFRHDEDLVLKFRVKSLGKIKNVVLDLKMTDHRGRNIFTTQFKLHDTHFKTPASSIDVLCKIPGGILVPGTYFPVVAIHEPNIEIIQYLERCVKFNILETGTIYSQFDGQDYGCVFMDCEWSSLFD